MLSRRACVSWGVVVAVVALLAGGHVVRTQRSIGHRAGDFAHSVRSMPGVAATKVTADAVGPRRDLSVQLADTASRAQLASVWDRAERMPTSVIKEMKIIIGTAYVEIWDESRVMAQSEDAQWALRDLRHGRVRVSCAGVTVDGWSDMVPVGVFASEVAAALDVPGIRDVGLRVAGDGDASEVSVSGYSTEANSALAALAPVASRIFRTELSGNRLDIDMAKGQQAHTAQVVAAARRAVDQLDRSQGSVPKFSVRRDGESTVTGTAAGDER